MKLPIALNRNTLLLLLGWACTQGPDIDAAAAWLQASHIPHAMGIVHLLGGLSLTLGALALAMPWIRKTMALVGLATPPGAQAPWIPGKDAVAPALTTMQIFEAVAASKMTPEQGAALMMGNRAPATTATPRSEDITKPFSPRTAYIKPTSPDNPTKT